MISRSAPANVYLGVLLATVVTLSLFVIDYDVEFLKQRPLLVQTDALLYRSFAFNWVDAPFDIMAKYVDMGNFRFNTIGLPTFGSLVYAFVGEWFDVLIVVLNVGLLALSIRNLMFVMRHFGYGDNDGQLMLAFVALPLFVTYSLGLSKEIPSFWIISLFLYLVVRKKYVWYLMVCVLSLFLRQHYFAIGLLFFVIHVMRVNRYAVLVVLSLVIPFLPKSFFGLTEWIIYDDRIRTLATMLALANLADIPGGFLVVLPLRLFLNLIQPVWPPAIIEVYELMKDEPLRAQDFIYHFSGLSAVILVAAAVLKSFVLRYRVPRALSEFVWSFCMVLGMLIYLHPRLYLTVIPVVALMVICSRRGPERRRPPVQSRSNASL